MFAALASARDQIIGVRRSSPAVLTFERLPGQTSRRDVPLPVSQLVYPRPAIAGGVTVCACYAEPGDTLWLANDAGVVRGLDVQVGAGAAIAIRPAAHPAAVFVAVVLPGGAKWQMLVVDAATLSVLFTDLAEQVPLPDGTTSGGFLEWLDGAAEPTWTDPARFSVVAGRSVVYALRRGDWTIGQDGEGPERVLAYHHPTATWWIAYDGLTQHAPQAAASVDGSCFVGITTGVGLYVHSRDFVRLTDTDEPAGVVASFALAPKPVRVQVFGGAGFRMNCGPQHDDLSVPYTGVFCTLGPDDVAQKVADAGWLGVPLYAYVDGRVYPPELVPVVDGVEVIPTVQAYPLRPRRPGPMEPIAESIESISDTIAALKTRWSRVAVVMAAYRQIDGTGRYNWPLQHVLDLQGEVWKLVCLYGLTDVLVFHENRANGKDGIASRPEFREFERRIKAAAVGRAPQPTPVPVPVSRFPRARSLSHA